MLDKDFMDKYGDLLDFHDGWALFQEKGQFRFVSPDGKQLTPFLFEDARHFSQKRAVVKLGGLWGIIDKWGNWVVEPKYAYLGGYCEGFAVCAVQQPSGKLLYGYVAWSGEEVIPPRFDYAVAFYKNVAWVKINKLWGLIDQRGIFVVQPKYYMYNNFNKKGYTKVVHNGKRVYLTTSGYEFQTEKEVKCFLKQIDRLTQETKTQKGFFQTQKDHIK